MQTHKTIKEYFEEYQIDCTYSKVLRPTTIKGYKDVMDNFLRTMPEIITLQDLSPFSVSEFFRRLGTKKQANGVGIRNSTARTYYNKLIIFFKWLEQRNYIEEGKLAKNISKPPSPIYEDDRALKQIEISKILSSITLYTIHDSFLYKRDKLIVNLLLYTGIRKGELLGLRIKDIDFINRTVFINGETSKSKKSRKIPLHPTLSMYLKDYLHERSKKKSTCEYLVISNNQDAKLTQHGLKHWVEKYKKHSKVNFHLHRFRHTFACTLAKNNTNITSIKNVMGHSSIRMTERYLRSISSEDSRDFINLLTF